MVESTTEANLSKWWVMKCHCTQWKVNITTFTNVRFPVQKYLPTLNHWIIFCNWILNCITLRQDTQHNGLNCYTRQDSILRLCRVSWCGWPGWHEKTYFGPMETFFVFDIAISCFSRTKSSLLRSSSSFECPRATCWNDIIIVENKFFLGFFWHWYN